MKKLSEVIVKGARTKKVAQKGSYQVPFILSQIFKWNHEKFLDFNGRPPSIKRQKRAPLKTT